MGCYPLLYGYLSSSVDAYTRDLIKYDRLAEVSALCNLLSALYVKCSTAELSEIACGLREVPGEDVQSGQ